MEVPAPPPALRERRIALAHDYLVQDGGAERVLKRLQALFPHAPTFTLLRDPKRFALPGRKVVTSFLNDWPGAVSRYMWLMPLMPMAIEHLDLSGYDLVVSTSSSFAKGLLAPPGALHVCYLHTPTRFLWHERLRYVDELRVPAPAKALLPPLLHRLRSWDRLAADRPDILLTNSATSRARIQRYYRRDADVIPPPVDVDRIRPVDGAGTYWVAGGRLVAYKRFDLLARTFARLGLPLKVFGDGPELAALRRIAGPQTEFLGRVHETEKIQLLQEAIGFLHPQEEDFGIAAVEAMAAGRPVIAYGRGGGAETVVHGVTGLHVAHQSWPHLADAVLRFDPRRFDRAAIRARAETFSAENFDRAILDRLAAAVSA
jgi:glycosyltransferase involved in cell wall biosynthesis